MNFREHEKGGNLFSAIEHQQKMTKRTVGVLKRSSIGMLSWLHGLSDDATEYQIGDRLSFMNFLDLQMGDHIPDAKTIC